MGASVRPYDDSLEVVRALRGRGVPTALVSNCSHNTRPIVARLGLEQEFDAVILSFEVGVMKPDPEIYREALERGSATPTPTARSSWTTRSATATRLPRSACRRS